MKRLGLVSVATLFVIFLSSWGMWGHYAINQSAIFSLPQPVAQFFYSHIDFISEGGNLPDVRKYSHLKDKAENPRHFIDIEDFGNIPFDSIRTRKWDEKSLQKWGNLPWFMSDTYKSLVNSMKTGRRTETLFSAAELGHYIADAHMPLHTSSNHDGQLTNQRGIHAHWEALLVERYAKSYNLKVAPATYITNVDAEIWNIIRDTHSLVDTLLAIDRKLRSEFPAEQLYEKDKDGKVVKNKFGQWVFTKEYSELLHKSLNGMVEKQMRKSIQQVSNFWYTAWVDAGKPDLLAMEQPELLKRTNKQYKKDVKIWQGGQLPYQYMEKEY